MFLSNQISLITQSGMGGTTNKLHSPAKNISGSCCYMGKVTTIILIIAICYLSFRCVNILYVWTVNSVNRLFKNPKHMTAITSPSKFGLASQEIATVKSFGLL